MLHGRQIVFVSHLYMTVAFWPATNCVIFRRVRQLINHKSWEKRGDIFGLGSETVAVRCNCETGSRMAVVAVLRPKLACNKTLTVSKVCEDDLTVWLPPTSTNQRVEITLITFLFLRVDIQSRTSYAVVQPASLSYSLHSANFMLLSGFVRSMSYIVAGCDLKGSEQAVQAAWASYGRWLCRRLRAVEMASGFFSNVLRCSRHHPRVFGAERGFSCGIYAKPGLLVSYVALANRM